MKIFSEVFENLKTSFPRFQPFLLLVGNISCLKRGGTMVIRGKCFAFLPHVLCSILLEEILLIFWALFHCFTSPSGKKIIIVHYEIRTFPMLHATFTHCTVYYHLATRILLFSNCYI